MTSQGWGIDGWWFVKNFRVLLNGQNLSIELDGKVRKVGFYTTRLVERGRGIVSKRLT